MILNFDKNKKRKLIFEDFFNFINFRIKVKDTSENIIKSFKLIDLYPFSLINLRNYPKLPKI